MLHAGWPEATEQSVTDTARAIAGVLLVESKGNQRKSDALEWIAVVAVTVMGLVIVIEAVAKTVIAVRAYR